MKPQELRIGNWGSIVTATSTIYFKVAELHKDGIITDSINGDQGTWDYNFTPIPLTPEILKKCGNLNHYFESGDDIQPSNDADNIILMACGEYQISKPLAYLHELQNAWFALTGEELEINLW